MWGLVAFEIRVTPYSDTRCRGLLISHKISFFFTFFVKFKCNFIIWPISSFKLKTRTNWIGQKFFQFFWNVKLLKREKVLNRQNLQMGGSRHSTGKGQFNITTRQWNICCIFKLQAMTGFLLSALCLDYSLK